MKKISALAMIICLVMCVNMLISCSNFDSSLNDNTQDNETENDNKPEISVDTEDEDYPEPSEGLEFSVYIDGKCLVSGIGSCKDTDIVIPYKTPEGYRVTGISEHAFAWQDNLTSITIPNSVTSIGERAFYDCTGLTTVTLGKGVVNIGDAAFLNCDSLAEIIVDTDNEHYRAIDGNLYSKDGQTLVQYAYGNTSTSFTIPEGVTVIATGAFCNCNSIENIEFPDSITSIGNSAFSNCYFLEDVEMPDGITNIGSRAFSDCYSLRSIKIPDSVTSIGDAAFAACANVTEIIVDTNNANYCSIDGNLYNKDRTVLIQYASGSYSTDFSIPEGVTTIATGAFKYSHSLENINIPDSVTSIGEDAFAYSGLTSVVISDSVTSIGEDAFYNCTSLTSVVIPDSVTSIGRSAFAYCTSLTSVEIPDSVTSIGVGAFDGCSGLTSATFENPNGWWYADYSDATSGTSLSSDDLSDPSVAVEYLRSTYYDYYWFRD